MSNKKDRESKRRLRIARKHKHLCRCFRCVGSKTAKWSKRELSKLITDKEA
jgi:hypothetical protein